MEKHTSSVLKGLKHEILIGSFLTFYYIFSFPDDTFLLLRGRGGRGFSVVSRRDVVQEAKNRFCCMDPVNGLKSTTKHEEQVLKLPDGNIVVVGDEATSAPELMFKPELAKCPKTRYEICL